MPAALTLLSLAVDLTGGSDSLYTNDGLDPVLSHEALLTGFTLIVTGTRDLLLNECAMVQPGSIDDGALRRRHRNLRL